MIASRSSPQLINVVLIRHLSFKVETWVQLGGIPTIRKEAQCINSQPELTQLAKQVLESWGDWL